MEAKPAAMGETSGTESMADREIVMIRVFDAPRERVFEAWTDPRHIGQWWGPRGFTITTQEMDVRVGGVWRFVMHAPNGTDYPNRITYQEIVKPERLVYLHDAGEDGDPEGFHVTAAFAEEGGNTRLTFRLLFATAEVRRQKAEFGAVELGHQTLDKLGEYLAQG